MGSGLKPKQLITDVVLMIIKGVGVCGQNASSHVSEENAARVVIPTSEHL